jgi:MoaA/NifB/PqqE/SkfB family radical SAM enzyme
MANAHLDLTDIVWEITGACRNNCSYCGSKANWKAPVDEELIKKISYEIYKFPPIEVNISGGDPLLVSYETHDEIIKLFKQEDIKCKIVVNVKSLINREVNHDNISKLELYDRIGVSLNTVNEISLFRKIENILPTDKITIITNFNVVNVFLFEEICKLVKEKNYLWMIQYTIYKTIDKRAVYYSNESFNYLKSKVTNALKEGVGIVVADNATSYPCAAGLKSVGILYDGSVVPCLSMRAWCRDIETEVQGNILTNGLKDIWVEGFRKQRFQNFVCCKDYCGRKCLLELEEEPTTYKLEDLHKIPDLKKELIIDEIFENNKKKIVPDQSPYVTLYGVADRNMYIYGVPDRFKDKKIE